MLSYNNNSPLSTDSQQQTKINEKPTRYILPDDRAVEANSSILGGKRFLTAKQLAALIGKHTKWLERKRWEGGGPAFRYIGKSPIYEEQDVLAWLDSIPTVKNTSQLV